MTVLQQQKRLAVDGNDKHTYTNTNTKKKKKKKKNAWMQGFSKQTSLTKTFYMQVFSESNAVISLG